MSFGFSIGDFIAVGQLAWQVYRKCKTASSEFKTISSQLISLHIVIKDVNETIEEWDLPEAKKSDLLQIGEDSKETLDELDQLLKKYSGLGMKSARTLDRLRYPRAHIEELRTRIESYINILTSFKTSLVLSSQARLEQMVSQIMAERQEGLREGSVISRESLAAAEDGDEDIWLNIKRELEDYGTITDTVLNEHRDFIIELLKSALADDHESQSALTGRILEAGQCETGQQAPAQNASEIIATMNALALTEEKSQRECRSILAADDDISQYLVDDLYDALSFYEMFCQEPAETSNRSQKDLSLKLHLLGRNIKVVQRLTSANAEFWNLALSRTIRDAEEALALTEPVVEHWLSKKINEGLWEPGTTRLAKLEGPDCNTKIETENYAVENDILTVKDNLQIVRTAMQVDNSRLPLHKVMHQQIAACQLSLLVLQCGALWSYARLAHHTTSFDGPQKTQAYAVHKQHLLVRSDKLMIRTNLLQALATSLSRANKNPHLLKFAFMTAWRVLPNSGQKLGDRNSVASCLNNLESLHLAYYDHHIKLGYQLIPKGPGPHAIPPFQKRVGSYLRDRRPYLRYRKTYRRRRNVDLPALNRDSRMLDEAILEDVSDRTVD